MLAVLLWACASAPPEGVRWQRAVRAETVDEGKTLCRTLSSAQDQAACLLDVMEIHDAVRPAGCQELDQGSWAYECWFRAAEQATDETVAARLCVRTGPFQRNCVHHRLELAIEKLVQEHDSVRALSREVDKVEQAWQPYSPDTPDAYQSLVREELWRIYTTRSPSVSYAACEQALGHHRLACADNVRLGIRRRLVNGSRKKNHKTASLCVEPELLFTKAAAWATGERAEQEARSWLAAWCAAGSPPMSVDDTEPAVLAIHSSGAETGR